MSLISFNFFVLLTIGVCIYYLLPKVCQNPVLIILSLVFCYYAGGIRTIAFLMFTTLSTFVGAYIIDKTKYQGLKKPLFVAVLLMNFAILFVMKYLGFFSGLFRLVGLNKFDAISIIAPLGVSFYTMQLIAYLADVFMGKIHAETKLINYMAFAFFFPQLTMGPINRYSEMQPQFAEGHKLSYKNITFGLQRMLWGLFKKLVISERAAVLVSTIYDNADSYPGLFVPFAAACFAVQLYTDFSGYMDIALGASELFDLKLAENFERPFFARNISEYWRRWHSTLGTWFKDYLFYPVLKSSLFVKLGKWGKEKLGKKRGKKVPMYLGLIVLWFSVGFWHGGLWKYIVGSGLLHCFYIIMEDLFDEPNAKLMAKIHVNTKSLGYHIYQSIRTFILVCYGFIFFRAASFGNGVHLTKLIFKANPAALKFAEYLNLGLDGKDMIVLAISIVLLFVISLLQEKGSIREMVAKLILPVRWILFYALFFAVLVFGFYGPGFISSAFIYQNF